MQNNKMMTVAAPQVRIALSVLFLTLAGIASIMHPPAIILVGFFLYQGVIRITTYDEDGRELPFKECLLVGPVQVLVAVGMVAFGISIENHFWGEVWIGVALWFLYGGFKSLHRVMKLGKLESVDSPAVVTAKQRTKVNKEEDALLADLASFFKNREDEDEGESK